MLKKLLREVNVESIVSCIQRILRCKSSIELYHPAIRALISDWPVNSFVMVQVFEKIFGCSLDRKFWLNFKKKIDRQPL